MKVAIFGATGFVGGYLVDALLAAGHEPAALVRPGSRARLRSAARCRVVDGDLADDAAIHATLQGCDAVIYNVGLLREYPSRGITFENAHYQGVRSSVDAALAAGVGRYLLMSANGVESRRTAYQDTKYRAERYLADSALASTVLRPSVIFGDPRGAMEFATQLYRDLVRPPLPAVGFHTGLSPSGGAVSMSPVHVVDVADAFVTALADGSTVGEILPLGGPETLTWPQMLRRVAAAGGRQKWVLPMPIGLMRLAATLFDRLPFFPVTRGQLDMLAQGNTAPADALTRLIGRAPREFSVHNLAYLLA